VRRDGFEGGGGGRSHLDEFKREFMGEEDIHENCETEDVSRERISEKRERERERKKEKERNEKGNKRVKNCFFCITSVARYPLMR
jgi:hypothetical protein